MLGMVLIVKIFGQPLLGTYVAWEGALSYCNTYGHPVTQLLYQRFRHIDIASGIDHSAIHEDLGDIIAHDL